MAHSEPNDPATQARNQVAQLRTMLERAVAAREQGRHDSAVRKGYELVEKALKAALLYVGVRPPAWINVGPQLEENEARFSQKFRDQLDIAVYAARVSWEEREPGIGVLGDEEVEDDPYDEYDAESAIDTATRVLEMVEELVKGS